MLLPQRTVMDEVRKILAENLIEALRQMQEYLVLAIGVSLWITDSVTPAVSSIVGQKVRLATLAATTKHRGTQSASGRAEENEHNCHEHQDEYQQGCHAFWSVQVAHKLP